MAFSGVVKHDEQEFTENSMNNLPSKTTIENAFASDEYKILIVANKFQTGFDQPLLHTTYVDKVLNGITAVQTLSRANRIYPNKNDTLILDFANKAEVIQKSFQPYYEVTFLSEATDPHKLYDLQDKLLSHQIFDEADVDNFVKSRQKGAPQPQLHAILNPLVEAFRQKGISPLKSPLSLILLKKLGIKPNELNVLFFSDFTCRVTECKHYKSIPKT